MARKSGQIIERGDRKFVLRIYLGTDGAGKRQYYNRTVHGTETDAKRELHKLLVKADAGELAKADPQTLTEYLEHWLQAAAKARLREPTYWQYKRQLSRYVTPKLGQSRLEKITPLQIQGLYGQMLDSGLSARTVRLTHAILRNALKQAVRWRMLRSNPADAVDLPKQQSREMATLDQDGAQRFLQAIKGDPHEVLMATLLGTGMRPSEAGGLRWSDVDLPGRRLHIRRTAAYVQGRWVFNPPKTAKGKRQIDLPDGLVSMLADHIRDGELVFTNFSGEPFMQRTVLEHHFRPALKRADLDDGMRLYDLRHTHASLLLLAGVHPKVVSERLGHSTIQITLDTYSHVLPSLQRDASDTVNEMLWGFDQFERVAGHRPAN